MVSTGVQNPNQVIYWEKQGQDMLCGLHCINSLLQGPIFDEISLSQIARELQQKENELLGRSNSGINMGAESDYLDNSGNYSIEVLSGALKQVNNIVTTPIGARSVTNVDMTAE